MDKLKSGLNKLKTATTSSVSVQSSAMAEDPTVPRTWLHGYLYITVEHASNVCGDHIRMLRHGAKLPVVGGLLSSVDTTLKNVTAQMRARCVAPISPSFTCCYITHECCQGCTCLEYS